MTTNRTATAALFDAADLTTFALFDSPFDGGDNVETAAEVVEEAPAAPADDRPGLTLTVYRVGHLPFPTRKAAEWHVFSYGPQGAEIVEEANTYHVGDAVTVHAFGQPKRPGVVTKLGRSRVTVDFLRNQSGRRHVTAFNAVDVRPA